MSMKCELYEKMVLDNVPIGRRVQHIEDCNECYHRFLEWEDEVSRAMIHFKKIKEEIETKIDELEKFGIERLGLNQKANIELMRQQLKWSYDKLVELRGSN